jgi:toxin YhaV
MSSRKIRRDRSTARAIPLGDDHKHWFRAKFFQQYRLFFRYHAPSKVIVYAWVNDEDTKRAYESSDDAYRVFRKMLDNGHPPDDWDQLLAEAQKKSQRMQESLARAVAGVCSRNGKNRTLRFIWRKG